MVPSFHPLGTGGGAGGSVVWKVRNLQQQRVLRLGRMRFQVLRDSLVQQELVLQARLRNTLALEQNLYSSRVCPVLWMRLAGLKDDLETEGLAGVG
jgi:hypothetical protein